MAASAIPAEAPHATTVAVKQEKSASSTDAGNIPTPTPTKAKLPPAPETGITIVKPPPTPPATSPTKLEPSLHQPVKVEPASPSITSTFPRSALKRKRQNAMDLDEPLPSPVKRSVTFSDTVEARVDDAIVERVRSEVGFALGSFAIGDVDAFDKIKGYFSPEEEAKTTIAVKPPRPSPDTLQLYVAALTSNVALLRRSCAPLVHAILDHDWTGQSDDYVAIYVRFLGGLVSSQGMWLTDSLRMLVDKFTAGSTPDSAVSGTTIQNRVHAALQYLLRLAPAASNVLGDATGGRLSLLAARFPHPSDTRRVHIRYVTGLLRLTQYAPALQAAVLTLVTERVVKIDVQVQLDFEDLADEIGDDLLSSLPPLTDDAPDDADEDSDDEDDMDEDDFNSDEARLQIIRASMGKLDAIMHLLFTHYSLLFASPSSAAASAASEILLSHFRSLILPTYRSRHTQFLLFHFMQSSPALIDAFLGSCVQLVLDRLRPPLVRQSAATYLASFVARGLRVPRQMAQEVFQFLADQLTALRHQYEPNCKGPDPRRYHAYYALVQALLYIFCFRWRDLALAPEDDGHSTSLSPPGLPGAASDNDEDDDLAHVQFPDAVRDALRDNIFSPLNPLRLCAPAIAAEFVDSARRLRVLYAHHVLATNKRVRILGSTGVAAPPVRMSRPRATSIPTSNTSTGPAGLAASAPAAPASSAAASAHDLQRSDAYLCLDGYFPFDPYRLPGSRHWVEGDYREWEPLEEEEESEEEDEDGESEEERDVDEGMGEEEGTGTEDGVDG